MFHYRSTPHTVTKISPFELFYGRKMRTRLAQAFPGVKNPGKGKRVAAQLEEKANDMKKWADEKRGSSG